MFYALYTLRDFILCYGILFILGASENNLFTNCDSEGDFKHDNISSFLEPGIIVFQA